jgi:Flp pilus assembly protein TadG
MATSQHHRSVSNRVRTDHSGQAMLEFAIIASLIITLVFALIDFGRAFNSLQVMIGLTRQGSNLASRGDSLTASAAAVVSGDAPLDLTDNGEVIVTSVTNSSNTNLITGQVSQGGISQVSKVGTGVGSVATVPASVAAMLQPGQTVYITEVYYSFQPITPIGSLLGVVMPSTLYEAAYF